MGCRPLDFAREALGPRCQVASPLGSVRQTPLGGRLGPPWGGAGRRGLGRRSRLRPAGAALAAPRPAARSPWQRGGRRDAGVGLLSGAHGRCSAGAAACGVFSAEVLPRLQCTTAFWSAPAAGAWAVRLVGGRRPHGTPRVAWQGASRRSPPGPVSPGSSLATGSLADASGLLVGGRRLRGAPCLACWGVSGRSPLGPMPPDSSLPKGSLVNASRGKAASAVRLQKGPRESNPSHSLKCPALRPLHHGRDTCTLVQFAPFGHWVDLEGGWQSPV